MFYLAERAGLWRLLKHMLAPNPVQRISSSKALKRYNEIMSNLENAVSTPTKEIDGKFFNSVIESLEVCVLPLGDKLEDNQDVINDSQLDKANDSEPNALCGLIIAACFP